MDSHSSQGAAVSTPSASLMAVFALCAGVIVANIYYAQPIIALIAPALNLSLSAASLLVSVTQIGYACGLFLLVPLGDLVENRRLMLTTVLGAAVALVLAATAHTSGVFLAACVLIGLTSVSVQMLVPLVAHLAPEASRGRVVGNVMGGLLLGILLARPVSSLVTDHFGWRVMFGAAAVAMLAVAVLIALRIPVRRPEARMRYGALIASLVSLMQQSPELRRRALYQACLFGAFSLFWTAVPLELAQGHGFSQTEIAGFAFIGAAGVLAGPIGGRLADAGFSRMATWCALGAGSLVLWLTIAPGLNHHWSALALAAVVLDMCVQVHLVVGQRAIFRLGAEQRSRYNALYMTSTFVGGAIGSATASVLFVNGGWTAVASLGGVVTLLAALASLRWESAHIESPAASVSRGS